MVDPLTYSSAEGVKPETLDPETLKAAIEKLKPQQFTTLEEWLGYTLAQGIKIVRMPDQPGLGKSAPMLVVPEALYDLLPEEAKR